MDAAVVESIPYSATPTDNILEKTFPVNPLPPPPAGSNYLDIGIYPAIEKLIVFTNQTRVNAYRLPTGNGTFLDVSWSHSNPNVTEPKISIAATGTNGTLTSTLSGTLNLDANPYVTDVSNHSGNAETIFGVADENATQDLNCQTTSTNINVFGHLPGHHHVKTRDYGADGLDGPDEGGCVND